MDQIIGQDDGKGLITHKWPGAQNGMTQPEGVMLDDVVTNCTGRGDIPHQFKQLPFIPLRPAPFPASHWVGSDPG